MTIFTKACAIVLLGILALSGCQTAPTTTPSRTVVITHPNDTQSDTTVVADPDTTSTVYDEPYEDEYTIEPYIPPVPDVETYEPYDPEPPVIRDNDVDIIVIPAPTRDSNPPIISQPQPPSLPSRNELLERARQNSQQQNRKPTENNSTLPAFRNLMQNGTAQLQAGNLTAAENSFTRAQRLAPRSSAVYFYLSQVALKKNQPRKAEAMARRGLSVSQDNSRRRALWQLILQSGQLQNNARVIREATQALK